MRSPDIWIFGSFQEFLDSPILQKRLTFARPYDYSENQLTLYLQPQKNCELDWADATIIRELEDLAINLIRR